VVGSTLIGASPVAMFFSPMNGSSMLGWVVEVEAALECAGEGHMRSHKVAAPRRADLGSLPRADWVLNK
jgi:hypothetical protein